MTRQQLRERIKRDLGYQYIKVELSDDHLNDSIDDAYTEYEDAQRKEEIYQFASQIGMDAELIREHVSEYEYAGLVNHEEISDAITAPLLKKRKIVNQIKDFITKHVAKYE